MGRHSRTSLHHWLCGNRWSQAPRSQSPPRFIPVRPLRSPSMDWQILLGEFCSLRMFQSRSGYFLDVALASATALDVIERYPIDIRSASSACRNMLQHDGTELPCPTHLKAVFGIPVSLPSIKFLRPQHQVSNSRHMSLNHLGQVVVITLQGRTPSSPSALSEARRFVNHMASRPRRWGSRVALAGQIVSCRRVDHHHRSSDQPHPRRPLYSLQGEV